MSEDLYLIAHKVRGEPAFDVAIKQTCTNCQSYESVTGAMVEPEVHQSECNTCDGDGYVWVTPTYGHRAYPYWSAHFNQIDFEMFRVDGNPYIDMPPNWPDHFPHSAEPGKAKIDVSLLAPAKPKPQRRF